MSILSPLAERMRPITLDDYKGQDHLLKDGASLRRALDSGLIPSMIFWGPPGVGKTTLAHLIANHLDRPFHVLSAISSGVKDVREVIQKVENAGMFQQSGTILFIDEIHRLSPIVEEYLYSAMEDYKIDIMIESGPNARSVQINLAPFTLVGATTRSGLLSAPMRSRFGITFRMEYYDAETLKHIVIACC